MEIKTVSCGVVRSNCYIITSGENAVVIDPGYMEKELKDFAASGKQKSGIYC
ncbi:MAG: MBL fold metallo-hydrolase [Acutalibacteraceae bacterium]